MSALNVCMERLGFLKSVLIISIHLPENKCILPTDLIKKDNYLQNV